MNRNNKLKIPKFKLNKKIVATCSAVAIAGSIVAVSLNNGDVFDPNAFNPNDKTQVNKADFSDNVYDDDKKNEQQDEKEQNQSNNNPANNQDAINQRQQKFSKNKNVVKAVSSKEKNGQSISIGKRNANSAGNGSLEFVGSNRGNTPIVDKIVTNNNADTNTNSHNTNNGNTNISSKPNSVNDSNTEYSQNENSKSPNATDNKPSNDNTVYGNNTDDDFYDGGGSIGTSSNNNNPAQPDTPSDDNSGNDSGNDNIKDPIPTLPKDILGDIGYDIKEFPSSGEDGDISDNISGGSSGGNHSGLADSNGSLIVTCDSVNDDFQRLYRGQTIDDWTLFCSIYVYYEDSNGNYYRITELNSDYIYFGEYNKTVEDDFSVEVYFRPNKNAQWMCSVADINVCDYRLLMCDGSGNVVYSTSFDDAEEGVDLLSCYSTIIEAGLPEAKDIFDDFGDESKKLDKLLVGWTDNLTTKEHIYKTRYYPSKQGKNVIYLLPTEEVSPEYDVQLLRNFGSVNYWYYLLQTLCDYTGEDDILNVPRGIQIVNINKPISEMIVPDTVLEVIFNYDYRCNDKYDVSEDNPNYRSENGVLISKDGTNVYDIPKNMKNVNIPSTVKYITINFDNNIENIYINSEYPPDISYIEFLNNANIFVPDEYYQSYIMAWGNQLGTNTITTINGADKDYQVDDTFVLSKDGTIVYNVKDNKNAVVRLPDGVTTIKDNAFSYNKSSQYCLLNKEVENMGNNLFDGSIVKKVMLRNSTPPAISQNTFNNNIEKIIIPKGSKQAYIDAWSSILGEDYCQKILTEENAILYTYIDGTKVLSDDDETTIIKFSDTASTFDKDYFKNNSVIRAEVFNRSDDDFVFVPEPEINKISNYAFANCNLQCADIPESIKEIDSNAFNGSYNLKMILIESKDNIKIWENAFANTNLYTVASNAMNAEFENGNSYIYTNAGLKCLYGASGYDNVCWSYRGQYGMVNSQFYIKMIDDNIYLYAVQTNGDIDDYRELEYAIVNNSDTFQLEYDVNSFADYSLCNQYNLTQITIPEYVDYIGRYAFSGTGLKSVTIPQSVYEIEPYAFAYSELESVNIECTNLKSMPEYMLYYCTNLRDVTFGDDVHIGTIKGGCFDCTSIEEIVLPKNVGELYYLCFSGMNSLNKVVFTSETPIDVVPPSRGVPFTFGYTTDIDFSIEVPNGCEQSYIDDWKYKVIQFNGSTPTEDELVEGENIVRKWFGMDEVDRTINVDDNNSSTEDTVVEDTTENVSQDITEDISNIGIDNSLNDTDNSDTDNSDILDETNQEINEEVSSEVPEENNDTQLDADYEQEIDESYEVSENIGE